MARRKILFITRSGPLSASSSANSVQPRAELLVAAVIGQRRQLQVPGRALATSWTTGSDDSGLPTTSAVAAAQASLTISAGESPIAARAAAHNRPAAHRVRKRSASRKTEPSSSSRDRAAEVAVVVADHSHHSACPWSQCIRADLAGRGHASGFWSSLAARKAACSSCSSSTSAPQSSAQLTSGANPPP
jgi:hypothetical protein